MFLMKSEKIVHRLMGEARFNETAEKAGGLNSEQMAQRNIRMIHPAFRIIAFAEPPTTKNKVN